MTVQIETAPAPDRRAPGAREPIVVPDQRTGSERVEEAITAAAADGRAEAVRRGPRRAEPRGRPGPRVPERDRQDRPAHRGAGGRPGQADRGRRVRPAHARHRRGRGHRARPAARRRPAHRRARRHARPQPPAGGEPAAGGLAGQALHRPRDAAARPDPGGQPRPDPGGREVRLHQGLQVLHLRHLVDPAGHHPRHGRPGPHHPAAGAPGRAGQQAGPDQAGPAPEARPRRDRRGAGRRVRHRRRTRWPTCSTTPGTR